MIKALIFDINGTIVDILTDESMEEIYRVMSGIMAYQGIDLDPENFRDIFWELNKRQRRDSKEEYPEFNVTAIFSDIIREHGSAYTFAMPDEIQRALPAFLAQSFRSLSLLKLEAYPGAINILESLSKKYRMAAVSDGQAVWAWPELHRTGIARFFEKVVISSDLGFRKPDPRMFKTALDAMNLTPDEVLFIGNDMFRDVLGPKQMGIRTVFFKSNQGDQKARGAEPDYIIYSFNQLPEAIRFLESDND